MKSYRYCGLMTVMSRKSFVDRLALASTRHHEVIIGTRGAELDEFFSIVVCRR